MSERNCKLLRRYARYLVKHPQTDFADVQQTYKMIKAAFAAANRRRRTQLRDGMLSELVGFEG